MLFTFCYPVDFPPKLITSADDYLLFCFRIKTNGSLPRDKRQCPYGSFSPPPSPRDPEQLYAEVNSPKLRNHSYENVTINSAQENSPRENQRFHYENVELRTPDNFEHRTPKGGSPYENVVILQSSPSYPHSPRTKIKTFIPKDRYVYNFNWSSQFRLYLVNVPNNVGWDRRLQIRDFFIGDIYACLDPYNKRLLYCR